MENYQDIKAMNISTLPSIQYNPQYVKDVYEGNIISKRTQYFDIGSITDCLLTTPKRFKDDYAIIENNVSPQMESLVKEYIRLKDEDPFSDQDTLILKARTSVDFDKRLLDKTVLQKFKEDGLPYLQFLEANEGKTIVSIVDYNLSTQLVVDVLMDHMVSGLFESDDNTDVFYQHIVEWSLETNNSSWPKSNKEDNFTTYKIKCKGLLDIIRINTRVNKINIIDIKTYDSNNGSFLKNYYTYNYFYQAAYYMLGVSHKYPYPKHNVESFKFLAIDKARRIKPLLYEMPDTHFRAALNGGKINNRDIVGIKSMLNDFAWHVSNNLWDYPREYYEKGTILIK